MPLFAILHADSEGIHSYSCTIVAASSEVAIAQHILENPDRWQALLQYAHLDDGDSRSIWYRIQADVVTPQALLTLINKTTLDVDFGEMLRIQPIEIHCLDNLVVKAYPKT